MSVAVAGLVVAAVGVVTAAYSTYETGRSARDIAKKNAERAAWKANQAKQAAEVRAGQYQREAKRRMAQMRAAYAVSGVSTTEGTPLLVLMESAEEAAKDELRIRRGGEQTAWGLLQEATIQRMAGRGAYQRGVLGAGASLLGGAARAYGAYRG